MLCPPIPRVEVVKVAWLPCSGTVAIATAPSMKMTFPGGLGPEANLTVAVKVTGWPEGSCVAEATMEVEVLIAKG
jgi:hypothetical protein